MQGFLGKILGLAARSGGLTAITDCSGQTKISYRDLQSEMESWCTQLKGLGLEAGERVMIVLPSSVDFVCATLGTIGAGGVVVPMNSLLTGFEFEQIAQASGAVGIVTTGKIAESFYASLLSTKDMRFVVTVDGPIKSHEMRSGLKIAFFNKEKSVGPPLVEPAPQQTITCHYTYKGLGYPVGVEHTYGAYSELAQDAAKAVNLKEGGIHFVGLPVYPVYGLALCFFLPLAHGCTLLLGDKASRGNLIQTLADHHVDVACVVPEILSYLAFLLQSKGISFAKVLKHRPLLISGGSYLYPALQEMITNSIAVDLMQGYGTTETLPCIFDFDGGGKRGTLGKPMGATQVKILNSCGHELSPGQVGEIWIKGPYNCTSFDKLPRESRLFFRGDWFRTGDLGYTDPGGHIYFSGRQESFSKVQSQMVDLLELEAVACRHPAIARAKTMINLDERMQTNLTLDVVAKRGKSVSEDNLIRFCRLHLSPHKVPKSVRFFRSNRSEQGKFSFG